MATVATKSLNCANGVSCLYGVMRQCLLLIHSIPNASGLYCGDGPYFHSQFRRSARRELPLHQHSIHLLHMITVFELIPARQIRSNGEVKQERAEPITEAETLIEKTTCSIYFEKRIFIAAIEQKWQAL